ncbi:MAG: flavodoxin FldA [Trichodesmium sp. MAG_R04]|nr:flavodoxin FldA [Trichodesmium sp. MAG_R04]
MSKIGLFVGSTTGKTEEAAEMIQKELGGETVVTIHNMDDVNPKDFDDYQNLIIGCPTWDIGELQSDWSAFYRKEIDKANFKGKKVAYFGTGDQIGYADNFQDAMGILEEKITKLGGTTIGYWPTDGYEQNESKAKQDEGENAGNFVGLALDDDNQRDLTDERIKKWVGQLKTEFGL